ncbi:hypothetical protein Hypma_004825 [Hypsizygus marmoreus]|uniref:Uncharacterized protein n=1 Tax=Hypsizygus marmoreus TaxID=39966 RepID=A0A369J771_HYPMA|nr:hypothetical protein Hypma_004825 [Hypsizygus marmoreus]
MKLDDIYKFLLPPPPTAQALKVLDLLTIVIVLEVRKTRLDLFEGQTERKETPQRLFQDLRPPDKWRSAFTELVSALERVLNHLCEHLEK